ncbi:hypothetical protein [Rheinheimera fenheensis]|uniref:hypothetical protein n=1 Tax=Rheinheimera fenheensis TaxID=3152295 RepID=UPI003260D0C4
MKSLKSLIRRIEALEDIVHEEILGGYEDLETLIRDAVSKELERQNRRNRVRSSARGNIGELARDRAMIRYRPDIDERRPGGAMIRYRPDIDERRPGGAMIRYRPDVDTRLNSLDPLDGVDGGANLLQPLLIQIASVLGIEQAKAALEKAQKAAGLDTPDNSDSDDTP